VHRRQYLAALGAAGAGALAGCAGVLGGGDSGSVDLTLDPGPSQDDDLPADQDAGDGYPPAFDEHPPEQAVDEGWFEPYDVAGRDVMNADETVTVTLAPIDVAYYWYARGEARFVDARPRYNYDRAHVYGAVSSPYNTALDGSVGDWATADRIVCYCRCPHHQSSIRAAELQSAGFERVYVIDEGFEPWLKDRNYPVVGSQVESNLEPVPIEGRTDAGDAGATAWARHAPTGQTEATKIGDDGTYGMVLRFADVDADSEITVETPSYEVTGRLADLAAGVVTGP